jgi:capsular polysaccharide biosynthesis protein
MLVITKSEETRKKRMISFLSILFTLVKIPLLYFILFPSYKSDTFAINAKNITKILSYP